MAPTLDHGLIPLLGEALEIFRSVLAGGIALSGEFLADERVYGHGVFSLQQTQLANEIKGTQATRFAAKSLYCARKIGLLISGSQVRRPPSSPTELRIPGPTLNRPFLWVFSPASFRSFGLR